MSSVLSIFWLTIIVITLFLYSSGFPNPYIHETLATTITSFLSSRDLVAECLNFSISSLISASFSI